MTFQKESDFEEALIKILTTKGWESTILKYPTEQDLIRNWASILFDNNRGIDRLGDYPLTDGEMQQIVEQIRELRTPLKLNGFINGKTVSVKRDNPDVEKSVFNSIHSVCLDTMPGWKTKGEEHSFLENY